MLFEMKDSQQWRQQSRKSYTENEKEKEKEMSENIKKKNRIKLEKNVFEQKIYENEIT